MRRTVLVDGYNVIRRDPALVRLERTSLELARNTLLSLLNTSPRFRNDDITVVFDGAKSVEAGVWGSRSYRRGRVQVMFSAPQQSADDVIKKLASQAPAGSLVVTDDREIRDAVGAHGATSANLTPREQQRPPRPGYTPAGRATGAWIKEDDYKPSDRGGKKGNGHKAPKKRNRPPQSLDW